MTKNKEILFCGVFFCGLFVGLIGYLCSYVTTNSEELFNNNYNSRQSILAAQNSRGTIYASDGQVLARTILNEQGEEERVYPYGSLFAHVVGYTDRGRVGLESTENYDLINTSVSLKEQLANEAAGRKNPGNDVYTTLHVTLQEAANRALGAYQGAIVVTNVKTGEILAMVSKPDYDPNEIAALWDQISTDTENSPLLNRATQGLYPPGSTFKIVTALEYIRENPENYSQYQYACNGVFTSGENRIQCFHGSVHGQVGLERSFAKSCNCSFANMGLSLDRGAFSNTINDLLFNRKIKLDFPVSTANVLLSADSTDADVIQTSIGQGRTQITPIQLNMITAAIANKGKLMEPHLVKETRDYNGNIISSATPSVYATFMTEEEASELSALMRSVVESGTGTKLAGLSYSAAGKTGSAEFNQVAEDSHAWFTGFAPAEEPEIAVTVLIETIGSGGDYAVPVAKRIFDAWFEGAY